MYTFDSRVRYSEADCNGYLSFNSLLNYFQDCSTFHSEDLGIGLDYMEREKLIWVLSSWQISVMRYPKIGERIKIGTLPYEFRKFLGYRNFIMYDVQGNPLAVANSMWSLLSTVNYRPVLPNELMLSKYKPEERLPMDYAPRKIIQSEKNYEILEEIVVRKHNLDTNMHVNNGQYIAIASELLPEGYKIKGMRAEYKKQAHLNDVFIPRKTIDGDRVIISLCDGQGEAYFVAEFKS